MWSLFSEGFKLVFECLTQMLWSASNFYRLWFFKEPCDKFIIEDVQLKEAVVADFVLNLQVYESKGLQPFDDLSERWWSKSFHLLGP